MNLQEIFEELPDFRLADRTRYSLSELLVISLFAILAGEEDYEDIAEYGLQHKDFLDVFYS